MKRTAQLYLLIVSIVGLAIFFILHLGSQLPAPATVLSTQSPTQIAHQVADAGAASVFASVESSLRQNAGNPLSRLLLQLFVIITASFLIGRIFTRCGQPAVIGEMVAGIFLGPSLFGLLAPNVFQFVFAASSLDGVEAPQSDWGMPVHVHRRYGTGRVGSAT